MKCRRLVVKSVGKIDSGSAAEWLLSGLLKHIEKIKEEDWNELKKQTGKKQKKVS